MLISARQAAFEILLRVQKQDAYASELLNSERLTSLSPADRGLCTELVMGALRWQSALDDDIQAVSSQKLNRLDAEVLVALRLGAYQLRFLDRVPAHAAVDESVELVKRARKRSAAPFANAVLRKLSGKYTDRKDEAVDPGVAAVQAHPLWLVERWVREFGAEQARRICEFDQQQTAVALRMPAREAEAIEARLRAEGIELVPGRLLRSARLVLSPHASVRNYDPHREAPDSAPAKTGTAVAENFKAHPSVSLEHRLAIQDEGSQLVGALVGTGSRILDCCAAPGNKTAMLAEVNPQASIVAVELHPHRAELLRRRLLALAGDFSAKPSAASTVDATDGMNFGRVEVLTADAVALPYGREFDRILADVPCSGTGTLARHPEIKWRLRPDDLADLQARQRAILAAALRHLAPGGVLVYATCSLETEENAAVVEEVLREHPAARLLDCRTRLRELQDQGELTWPELDSLTSGPYLRTLPGTHPCDGFFAAMITT